MEQLQSGRVERISWLFALGRLLSVSFFFFFKLLRALALLCNTSLFSKDSLTKRIPVRPALTKRFWTGEMSYGHSQHTKSTLPHQSGNDAFEMNTARKANLQGSKHDMSKKGNDVTIFATQGRDSDGDSTERIMDGGIVVNTWVNVESETASHRHAGPMGLDSSYRDDRHT